MSNKNRDRDQNQTFDESAETFEAPVSDAKKAAQEVKAKARKEAKDRIVAFLKANADELGALKGDIELFIGKGQAQRGKVVSKSVNSELRAAFIEAGDAGLSEMDIFKKFKIGRPEMATKIRILVLCPNTEDRIWVKFNEPTETYHIVGVGTAAPEGWDGYVPAEKVNL